jgi:serine/threonine protein phosphatase PrpC
MASPKTAPGPGPAPSATAAVIEGQVHAYGLSDVGKKRQHNEDAYLIDESLGLYVVCDGMGGHAAGEVASAQAIKSIKQCVEAEKGTLDTFRKAPAENRETATAVAEKAIQKACGDIYAMALADTSKRGMGTTCVLMIVVGSKALIGHVGDSRIYLLRGGQAHRLTEDHTLIQQQIKAGVITKEQAAASQYKNVITRAVGIQASVQVDTLLVDLAPGDVFLLCSDGLHGYLPDEEVALLLAAPPERTPKHLVDLANQRGGKDNITAVVLSIGGAPAQARDTAARMEALRRIPLFKHLTYKEQTAILAIANARSFDKSEVIFNEGDAGDELYILIKGSVKIEKGEQFLAKVGPGGHFGEMSLIEQAPRSATVRVEEPTTCLAVGRSDLMALMRREQLLAVKLLWSFVQVLSDRLRDANSALASTKSELAHHITQPFAAE